MAEDLVAIGLILVGRSSSGSSLSLCLSPEELGRPATSSAIRKEVLTGESPTLAGFNESSVATFKPFHTQIEQKFIRFEQKYVRIEQNVDGKIELNKIKLN